MLMKRVLNLIEVHGSLASVNATAIAHVEEEAEVALDGAEVENLETRDNRYDGLCASREGELHLGREYGF